MRTLLRPLALATTALLLGVLLTACHKDSCDNASARFAAPVRGGRGGGGHSSVHKSGRGSTGHVTNHGSSDDDCDD